MAGRDAFGMFGATGVPPPPGSVPSLRLAYSTEGTPVYQPATLPVYGTAAGDGPPPAATTVAVTQEGGSGGVVGEQGKKKRGRPRKYGPDGTMALALSPVSPPGSELAQATAQPSGLPSPTADSSGKKARGRPPGSGKKQQLAALGSAGVGFTPHIIYVNPGEDVSSKIMSFSQQSSRAICILSANGALSNVTLRQAASSGGTLTLEGRYEILSLSGSFLLSESGGQRSRTGGLSVSLACSDGRVIGGGVAGLLTAASHVQVIVGSFLPEGPTKLYSPEPSSAPQKLIPHRGNTGATSPPSRGTLSESSGGAGSPINQNASAYNGNNSHGLGNVQWK